MNNKNRKILIIRPDRIGDVVVTTPLIRAVKLSFPGSTIGMMVHPATKQILDHNPHIDHFFVDDPESLHAGSRGFREQVALLRSHRFDTALMPLPKERYAWMTLFAGIPKRVGLGHKLFQVITGMKMISRNNYIPLKHEADYVLDLGRAIGTVHNDLTTQIVVSKEEMETARKFLTQSGFDLSKPIIGVNPFSRNSAPNWPLERFHRLIKVLSPRYQILIDAEPSNMEVIADFPRAMPNVKIISSPSLRALIAAIDQLSVMLTSSTGPMHIAAALGVPTVSPFCPLTACSPKLWGPLGNRSAVFLPSPHYCQTRCPGDPKNCPLEEIDDNAVLKEIDKFAAERKRGNNQFIEKNS